MFVCVFCYLVICREPSIEGDRESLEYRSFDFSSLVVRDGRVRVLMLAYSENAVLEKVEVAISQVERMPNIPGGPSAGWP